MDDTDPESDETFTVTLTDQAAASFVGTPGTATVTIQDDDAEAIPTLGEWGLVLFAGALLLLGLGVLRRRGWSGVALVLLLAAAVAMPVAADQGKEPPKSKDVYVTTVSSMLAKDGTMVLTLVDEGVLSVPASRVKIREGHVKPPRGAKAGRTRAEMTREERRAERHARKAERSPRTVTKALASGRPALVVVKRNLERGTVERVKITLFDSLEDARSELRRKEEGRKHPRK